MKKRPLHFESGLASLALATFFCFNQPAAAQSAPAQDRPAQDRDTTRQELARFDQFLDSHREIAEQLRKDPSLVNNGEFVKNHPALQTYLQDHPGIREEIKENPNSFMRQENRYDRQEDNRDRDTNRQELANFDRFLDSHREISEQLRKDPSLVNREQFVKDHPALQTYLQDHPGVREEIRENPDSFMKAENREDRQENRRDRDTTRQELASFDRFLDSHHEISEQVRKDPSLVNKEEFVKDHPALQAYLQEHPGVRKEVKENPNAFMQEEARYDHREDGVDRDRRDDGRDRDRHDDMDRDAMHRHFGEFLNGHSEIAERLSKDPSLVKNQAFMDGHPELKEYLNQHPDDQKELMANPQTFVKSSQQFNVKSPAAPPKPKQ
jgi:dsDNA-binding SOS-regulon protein